MLTLYIHPGLHMPLTFGGPAFNVLGQEEGGPFLSLEGGGGQNRVKFSPRSC